MWSLLSLSVTSRAGPVPSGIDLVPFALWRSNELDPEDLVRGLDPELVWFAYEHEPWRPAAQRHRAESRDPAA